MQIVIREKYSDFYVTFKLSNFFFNLLRFIFNTIFYYLKCLEKSRFIESRFRTEFTKDTGFFITFEFFNSFFFYFTTIAFYRIC